MIKPTLKLEALHGLPGEIVQAIDLYTEADMVAVLSNCLVLFGNVIGRGPHFRVEETLHFTNLYAIQVGQTAKARKGQGLSTIKRLFRAVDPEWTKEKLTSGLSSGEGLIFHVRDEVAEKQPVREGGHVIDYDEVITDSGISDKRLLVVEEEFAQPLKKMDSYGNILSPTIRDAWDGKDLHPLTKNNPIRATEAHISIIGHITQDELLRNLTQTEMGNGFANRFLWLYVERSKVIPSPTGLPTNIMEVLAARLKDAVEFGRSVGEMKRSRTAEALWRGFYAELSEGKPGLVGAITSRAEAQVLRLSLVYGMADCSAIIHFKHLEAALALWEYSEQSCKQIFGDRLGDPTADKIIQALREQGEMDETKVRDLFGRHRSGAENDRALDLLNRLGLATWRTEATRGRPKTIWTAT